MNSLAVAKDLLFRATRKPIEVVSGDRTLQLVFQESLIDNCCHLSLKEAGVVISEYPNITYENAVDRISMALSKGVILLK